VYRLDDDNCILFTNQHHGQRVKAQSLFNLKREEQRQLWILTDEVLRGAQWANGAFAWFIVLAASPQKIKKSRQWQKDHNPGMHYISNWEWNEIFAAFR